MSKYELKDVILGLRMEYIKLGEMLNEIRSMVTLPDPRDTLDFECYKNNETKVTDLKLMVLRKQSAILKILQSLGKNVINTDLEKRYPLQVLPKGGEHGLIIGDTKNIIIPENPNDLFYKADEVLSSKLIQESPSKFIIRGKTDHVSTRKEISVYPFGINVHCWEKTGNYSSTPSEFLGYQSDGDIINYTAYRDLAISPSLEDLLHTPIPENGLTNFQKEVIDKSGIQKKELFLEHELFIEDTTHYNITDLGNKIVLRRTK